MNIIYEYTNVSGSQRLESYVEEKMALLGKKYPFIIRADVFFKKENTEDNANKECGIRLSVPGPRLFASSSKQSFETAINESIKSLAVQLEKQKSNYNTYHN
ncbi:ribosome hibernation-promoting factor, HPF/YfiA family [Aquimarina agarivorans]|uniref:ribosome hibernation-promoting factor, HPF/YfiA family n=1 Tax=Aquimarina agarivorans TaxID=980584 RepID=UPI000248EA3A|nr:ribosome-associated translation inhibitor RaiA [Aquimarina agarivorans]